jgi:hypothetical protein
MTGNLPTETGRPKNSTVQLCSRLESGLAVMRMRSRMMVKTRRRMNGSRRLSLGGMGASFYPSSCLRFDTGFRKIFGTKSAATSSPPVHGLTLKKLLAKRAAKKRARKASTATATPPTAAISTSASASLAATSTSTATRPSWTMMSKR